ncbi:ankyrin repeat-containing domain protein [Mariannaea sp. PMI_226]|nr:ankyrin repeat-containing domain protein [Mariannaea sp. PMI_226]
MLRLPNELLRAIAAKVEHQRDVNALARTNRRLFSCLDSILYERDLQEPQGSWALQLAADRGQEQTAKKAIHFGAQDIGVALYVSASKGHEGVTRILLASYTHNGAGIQAQHAQEAVHAAAFWGKGSVLRLLLDSRMFDLNSIGGFSGCSPLASAASNGDQPIVKMLLEMGADPDHRDVFGRTPLSRAAGFGKESIVTMLLDTGEVKIDSRDDRGRTPLSHAAEQGFESIVKILLDTEEWWFIWRVVMRVRV